MQNMHLRIGTTTRHYLLCQWQLICQFYRQRDNIMICCLANICCPGQISEPYGGHAASHCVRRRYRRPPTSTVAHLSLHLHYRRRCMAAWQQAEAQQHCSCSWSRPTASTALPLPSPAATVLQQRLQRRGAIGAGAIRQSQKDCQWWRPVRNTRINVRKGK